MEIVWNGSHRICGIKSHMDISRLKQDSQVVSIYQYGIHRRLSSVWRTGDAFE